MKRKVISIVSISLFSIILWVFISLSGEFFATLHFPVRMINISDEHAVSNTSVDKVSLSLKGQGWQLAQLTFARNPEFLINTSGETGKQAVTLRNLLDHNNWLSSSIQVIEIEPEQIEFNIEKKIFKRVRVVPDINLEFKPGYGLVSEITVIKDSVNIWGPKSLVEQIYFVTTKQKDLVNIDRKISSQLELKEISDVEFDETECVVQLDVQKIVDKTFDNVPVETRRLPSTRRLQLFPDKISVVLRGGINILGMLNESDIKAYVFYQDALRDTMGSIIPRIEIPQQTTFIDNKPKRLEYIIKQY